MREDKLKIVYFKTSGKWYAEEEIVLKQENEYSWLIKTNREKREAILAANDGKAPGLSTKGDDFIWVCSPTPDDSWGFPVLLLPVGMELPRP